MPGSPRDTLALWNGTFQQKSWLTEWLTDSQIYKSAWEKGCWIPAVLRAKQAMYIKDLIPKFHPNKGGALTPSFPSWCSPADVWRKMKHSIGVQKSWEADTKDGCRSKHFSLHKKTGQPEILFLMFFIIVWLSSSPISLAGTSGHLDI